jgi:hypothetical protein
MRAVCVHTISTVSSRYMPGNGKLVSAAKCLRQGAGKLTPIFLGYNTTLHIDGYARVEGSSELMKTTSGNFTLVNSLAIPTAESPVAGMLTSYSFIR